MNVFDEFENRHMAGLAAEMREASIDCGDGMIIPRIPKWMSDAWKECGQAGLPDEDGE